MSQTLSIYNFCFSDLLYNLWLSLSHTLSFFFYMSTSVTRWLDYFSLFHYLTTTQICPKIINVAKVCLKFYQTQNEPSRVCLRFNKVCPSDEIWPNLVTFCQRQKYFLLRMTMMTTKISIFANLINCRLECSK